MTDETLLGLILIGSVLLAWGITHLTTTRKAQR